MHHSLHPLLITEANVDAVLCDVLPLAADAASLDVPPRPLAGR
jgi:hypothetical protein